MVGVIMVGVMGFGMFGVDVVDVLCWFGFCVIGWSCSFCDIVGIECFYGVVGMDVFFCKIDILVCLLLLMLEMYGIFNCDVFMRLYCDSLFGVFVLINVGCGGL